MRVDNVVIHFCLYLFAIMVVCAVIGCDNTTKKGTVNVSFFKIKCRDEFFQRLWIERLNRKSYVVTNNSAICSDHFAPECFERDFYAEFMNLKKPRKLKANAVPTLFNRASTDISRKRRSPQQNTDRQGIIELMRAECGRRDRSNSASSSEDIQPVSKKQVISSAASNSSTLESAISTTPSVITSANCFNVNSVHVQTDTCKFKESATQTPYIVTPIIKKPTTISRCVQTEESATFVDKEVQYCVEDIGESFMNSYSIHSYCKQPTYMSPVFASTPKRNKNKCHAETPTKFQDSFMSEISKEDSRDLYEPSSQESSSSSNSSSISDCDSDILMNKPKSPEDENKFVVFESSLISLFKICHVCGGPSVALEKSKIGSMIRLTSTCHHGHQHQWFSQPRIGKMPAGNLLMAASLLYTGGSMTQLSHFSELLKLGLFSRSTYDNIQKVLFHVVNEAWLIEKEEIRNNITQDSRDLWLAGDGRCDSPGFSAKYCTYSLLDQHSGKIVDYSLIHVGEVANKSTNMEKQGMIRCVESLKKDNIKIKVLATDRHLQIGATLRLDYPDIIHQYDVWHLGKALTKKLTEKARQRGCEELGNWISACVNHFWWSASTCGGSAVSLKERWMSILHHSTNVHRWNSADEFHQCEHPPIDGTKKKWLKPSSKPHDALRDVVMDKRIVKAMEKLTLFCHTGDLEVFHSMMLKYCPKRQHFSYSGMEARTQLAILDHNHGVNREQAVSTRGHSKGEKRFKQVFPKRSKEWVAKPVYEEKDYHYRKKLVARTVEIKQNDTPLILPNVPASCRVNIATKPKPPKHVTVEKHVSRLKRKRPMESASSED